MLFNPINFVCLFFCSISEDEDDQDPDDFDDDDDSEENGGKYMCTYALRSGMCLQPLRKGHGNNNSKTKKKTEKFAIKWTSPLL